MSTSGTVHTSASHADAPLTLTEPPARTLGFRESAGLWGNLGISLLLPVAAVYVVLPGRPLSVTLAAIVVGAVIGASLLGLAAAAGAREGVEGATADVWAAANRASPVRNSLRRPYRSPMRPKKSDPNGRTTKPTANVDRYAISASVESPCG